MANSVLSDQELLKKIKWLMFFRILFTLFLLGSTIIIQLGQRLSFRTPQLLLLYGINALVFLLSIGYAGVLRQKKEIASLAHLQIVLDTVIVSLVVYATGCFVSIFSFLYLLVIVYSSFLFSRKGSMFIAALSSIQYGLMVELEYYGILKTFAPSRFFANSGDLALVTYKVVVTMIACFAVAWLSSYLSEQVRSSRKELQAMEEHVRRVDRMAYMGEMAAGLAHEIRNPLASLIGSIQLLKEELPLSAGQDKLMRIVLREAGRLNSLVTDFLLFAKPPSGNISTIRVDEAINDTLALLKNDEKFHAGISVTTDLIPSVRIAMDPIHFRQILWNVLLNAAQAMPDSGGIQIAMKSRANGDVDVRVTDTGKGIDPEHLPLIFNPFFTTKAGGTGLGLSIVHRLLETYGGRMDVESSAGCGAKVTVRLKTIGD